MMVFQGVVGEITIPKGTLPPGAVVTITPSSAQDPPSEPTCSGDKDSVSGEIGQISFEDGHEDQ